MQVATSQELLLLLFVAAIFLFFMLVTIGMTLSRMKKRRKDIDKRMKELELEMGIQYK